MGSTDEDRLLAQDTAILKALRTLGRHVYWDEVQDGDILLVISATAGGTRVQLGNAVAERLWTVEEATGWRLRATDDIHYLGSTTKFLDVFDQWNLRKELDKEAIQALQTAASDADSDLIITSALNTARSPVPVQFYSMKGGGLRLDAPYGTFASEDLADWSFIGRPSYLVRHLPRS